MKALKRITTSITSQIEWIARQLENHESLVDSTIREIQESAARATVQLERVKRDGLKLESRIAEQSREEDLWVNRAKEVSAQDEAKAIECLRRKRDVTRSLEQLSKEHKEHKRIEEQLTKDIAKVNEKLRTLTMQRNIMRTRQSRADALKNTHSSLASVGTDLEDIFDRWEVKLVSNELQTDCLASPLDDLNYEFNCKEEEESLRAELEILMGK